LVTFHTKNKNKKFNFIFYGKSRSSEVTNARHYESLSRASKALKDVLYGLDSGITGDLLAMDIRQSLRFLGEITGEISTDDLLDSIF